MRLIRKHSDIFWKLADRNACRYFFFYQKASLLSMSHSDEGWLHKAVEVEGQLHIIEELQVFEERQPVNNVLISAKQVACLHTHAHTPSNLQI